MAIDDSGSVEGIYAFIYCTKWRFGQVSRVPDGRTDGQTLKDRATQLYIKYKIGALVTQYQALLREKTCTRTKKAMLHTRRLSCLKNLDMSSGIYSYGRLNKNVG